MNAMAAIEEQLAAELDAEMSNVKSTPEDEAEQLADIHRRMVTKHEQRAADTRKGLKATLAALAVSGKDEKRRHAEAMAVIAERIAEAKEVARRDTLADQKVAVASRAWLKAAAE